MTSESNSVRLYGRTRQDVVDRFMDLITDSGFPAPDVVEWGDHEVRFLWSDRKVAVVIDLDDVGNGTRRGPVTVAA